MNGAVITVSQLNRYVKSVLDGDLKLKSVFVSGEISNLKINSFSGHMYFTLKDDSAALKAVMFKSNASRLKFLPKDGMKVICRGAVTVYERDGAYQLYAADLQPDGAGSIAVAFEQLKEKLAAEGLFNEALKKKIPPYPRKIAVITSETGAAVHDMINVLERRWPLCGIVMCPVRVQGEGAAEQMCEALREVNLRTDCDVIIIGRGGGSAEDLWCFNDEALARAVVASSIPVISAVGHETDFTICDFAADLRAPTPSAAAEIAVPDIGEISANVFILAERAETQMLSLLEAAERKVGLLTERRVLKDPLAAVELPGLRLDNLRSRLDSKFSSLLFEAENSLSAYTAKLDALNPAKILLRGYSIAQKDGALIKSAGELMCGDEVDIIFSDGKVKCTVNETERKL